MRKFFILTLMVACLMMVSCVERRNRVILDRFVPFSTENNCVLKPGGDTYFTEGVIDLALTFDYKLAFQFTNYIPASDGGQTDLTTSEANYFYADEAEIEYEWDPKPQADGRKLSLDTKLWNEKKKVAVHGIVLNPDGGGQAVGWVHIFEEAQAKNLLDHVNDIDWIASPLVVKIRVVGKIADGTTVKTNKLNFNIRPTFGTTIQMGSVYYMPEGGYPEPTEGNKLSQEEYDAIMSQCAFNDPLIGGCFSGQDYSQVNCYVKETGPWENWEKYIADSYCQSESSCYIPGYEAAGVVEMVYNTLKKSGDDAGSYVCCPGEAPEAPEEKEGEENESEQQSGE